MAPFVRVASRVCLVWAELNAVIFHRLFSSCFPELLFIEGKEAQKKLLLQARLKTRLKAWRGIWFLLLWFFLPLVFIWTHGFSMLGATFWAGRLSLGVLFCIVLVAPALFVQLLVEFLIRREMTRRKLRALLVEQGIAVCIGCGYDLRGQTEPRCPECDRPFDAALLNRRELAG